MKLSASFDGVRRDLNTYVDGGKVEATIDVCADSECGEVKVWDGANWVYLSAADARGMAEFLTRCADIAEGKS